MILGQLLIIFFCNFIIDSIDISNIFSSINHVSKCRDQIRCMLFAIEIIYLRVCVCMVQCALWFLDARKSSVGCQHLIDERSNKPAFLWSVRIIYCDKMDFDKWRSFHIWSNLVCGASMVFSGMNCFDCWSLVTIRYFKCFGCLSFLVCTFCCWHFCLQQLGCSVFFLVGIFFILAHTKFLLAHCTFSSFSLCSSAVSSFEYLLLAIIIAYNLFYLNQKCFRRFLEVCVVGDTVLVLVLVLRRWCDVLYVWLVFAIIVILWTCHCDFLLYTVTWYTFKVGGAFFVYRLLHRSWSVCT